MGLPEVSQLDMYQLDPLEKPLSPDLIIPIAHIIAPVLWEIQTVVNIIAPRFQGLQLTPSSQLTGRLVTKRTREFIQHRFT